MIYDCFHFNNEVDLLEIRLNHHGAFVDIFVLTECPWTYSGKPKPLIYNQIKDLKPFSKFADRIIHNVYGVPPNGKANWDYEHDQRNSLRRYAIDFTDEDLIIYADCDEILRGPEVVEKALKYNQVVTLDMKMCWYYFNCQVMPGEGFCNDYSLERCFNHRWKMAKICRPRHLFEYPNIYKMRQDFLWNLDDAVVIPDAGWHFSNIGEPLSIYDKFCAFSHSNELNEKYSISPEAIENRKATLRDPLGRDVKFIRTELDVPGYVEANYERFSRHILA